MDEERVRILRMLQEGQIDAAGAAALLTAMKGDEEPAGGEEPVVEILPPLPKAKEVREVRWARFWVYPLIGGGVSTILGSLIMALVYATGAAHGWLAFGWFFLVLGGLVIILALWSQRAKWLHIRVREASGRTFTLSFPLPLTLAAWVLRVAQPYVPRLRDMGVDDLIIALRDHPRGEPLTINVAEGEEGESVQVYIG